MKGDEPLSISWTFHGGQSRSDPGILTSPIGSRGSMLVISSVGRDHNGNYTCSAKNEAGSASQTAVLRVNGNHSHRGSREGTDIIDSCCLLLFAIPQNNDAWYGRDVRV